MKRINKIILLSVLTLGIISCKQKDISFTTISLTKDGTNASGPFLTKDNKGSTVICWSEKGAQDSVFMLKYAVFDSVEDKFGAAVSVPGSAGMSTSPESMGKVAFKSDNTVIAVFAKAFKNEKNPFAGAIYYTSSNNEGKTWTSPQFLHSDTAHTYGRSFFDIISLSNGEVAAIWLDGRYGKEIKGSSLFFARTEKNKGFGEDTCLYKGTCECCRTDLLNDKNGNLHIAYRSILFPTTLLGKQARDMVYGFSKNNGNSFSPAKTISKDNWAIEGCPHTGPSLAVNKNGVNAVWFTAGGNSGIYYTSAAEMGTGFQNRRLVTSAGKHPQVTSFKDGALAMVCEESIESTSHQHISTKHGMNHAKAGNAKIVLRLLDGKEADKALDITNGEKADHHAVITTTAQNLLIAWVREEKGHSIICYTLINDSNLSGLK